MMNGTLSTDYLADEMPYTPPSLGFVTAIIGITFTLTMTMIAVVFARLFIRINGGVRSVRLVDWVHLLACLFSVAVSVTAVIGVRYCVGRRKFDITASDTINGLKYYWISRILYIVATWVVKMAILATLLLASPAPLRVRKSLIYSVMVFTTVYTVGFWIGAVVECTPVRGIYDRRGIREGQCLPLNAVRVMANGYAVANVVTDLLVVILSLFITVYGTKRSMRENIALGVVFILAFFATSAAGVHTLCEFYHGNPGGFTYDNNSPAIWAIVEINVGLIAVNLPALSPLFHNLLRPRTPPTGDDPNPRPHSPTTLAMAGVDKDHLDHSESQQHIIYDHPPLAPPAPLFAARSTQRFSSDSKSSLSEIMTVQLDIDIENHPIFREQRKGHRRTLTPLMF